MRPKRQEQLGRPLRGASMRSENCPGVLNQTLAAFRIPQEFGNTSDERIRVRRSESAVVVEKGFGHGSEILHVRPEDDRLPGQDRLDRILSASCREALADEHYGRYSIPVPQLPGGVEQEAVWLNDPPVLYAAAQSDAQTKLLQARHNLSRALHVPRRDDKNERRELCSKTLEHAGENLLFSGMRAPRQENRSGLLDAIGAENSPRQEAIATCVCGIVFDAADFLNHVWCDA